MKRLKLAIDSREYDNESIYSTISSCIENINIELENIESRLGEFPDENMESDFEGAKQEFEDSVAEYVSNINFLADDIYTAASNAKDNGVYNEDQLANGNSEIIELKDTLSQLNNELESIEGEHTDLSIQVEEIQSKIDNIKSQLDDTSVASVNSRLKKLGTKYSVICDAHDAIKESSEKIVDQCGNFGGFDKDYDEYQNSINVVKDGVYDIEDALGQAKDMNSRMGNGINKKISEISGLNDDIKEITDNIEKSKDKKSDLENELNELSAVLLKLENQM